MDVSEKCEICGGEDLINDNGFFFCSECGTQSQQAREQYVVKEKIESSQVAIPTPIKEEENNDEKEEKVTILEKFQKILQIQCNALIRLGCDPSLKEAVKLVWFRFLKYSGYAFKNSIELPIKCMHQDLSEKQLKYKNNPKVRSNETAKQVKNRITKARAPKRKQSLCPSCKNSLPTLTPHVTKKECTCKACVRFGKLKAGTSRDLDDENFVCECESMPSKRRRISKKTKASPMKIKRKSVTEMSRNAQKGHTGVGIKAKIQSNKHEFSSKNKGARRKIDFDAELSHDLEKLLHPTETTSTVKTAEAKVGYDGDFLEKAGKMLSTNVKEEPNSPLSGFSDDVHLFEESSASDEENTASVEKLVSKDNSKEEADEYYKTLKKQGGSHMRVLSLKHTVAICYLGLLYTQQNVLLSDFARWIQLNQFPYHNVLSLLPSSYFQSKDATSLSSKAGDMSADQLYIFLRNLCWYLPLPPIPTITPTTMCQIFTKKLHLPEYFNKMVGRALSCIESPEFDAAFIHTHRTFEIRCMSIVVYLLRMAYRLDDIYEFEMVEWVRQDCQEENPPDDGDYLYLWEDWVALYCKKRLVSLSNGIPENKSELALVTNPSNFIEYCHDELLTSARFNPTDKNPDTLQPLDPEFCSELSDIIKRARLKTNKWAELPPGCNDKRQCEVTFRPIRRVYVSDLVKSEHVSWKLFDCLQRGPKSNRFHEIEFSHSFKFLLQTCSNILDVSATELYEQVCCIESQIVSATDTLKQAYSILLEFKTGNKYQYSEKQTHSQTQTEEALFPLPQRVQNVSQNKKPSSRIPFRRWMFVPETDDPEVRIPLGRWKFEKKTQTDDIQYSSISESQTSSHELNFSCHDSQFQEIMNMSLSEFEINDLFDFSSDAQSQDSDSVDIHAPLLETKGSPQPSVSSKIETLGSSFDTEGATQHSGSTFDTESAPQYSESQLHIKIQDSNVAFSETKNCITIESPSQIFNIHEFQASGMQESDCQELGSGAHLSQLHEPQPPIVVPPSPGLKHRFPQLQEALLSMFEYQLSQTVNRCPEIPVPQVEAVPQTVIQCKESVPQTGIKHREDITSETETETQFHAIAAQQAKTRFLPVPFCNVIVDSQSPSLSQIEPECPELTDSQYQTLFMDVTKPHSQESTSSLFQCNAGIAHPPSPKLSALQIEDELSISCTNHLFQEETFSTLAKSDACCTLENSSEKGVGLNADNQE